MTIYNYPIPHYDGSGMNKLLLSSQNYDFLISSLILHLFTDRALPSLLFIPS
jgi:hypothetical protein